MFKTGQIIMHIELEYVEKVSEVTEDYVVCESGRFIDAEDLEDWEVRTHKPEKSSFDDFWPTWRDNSL